MNAWLGETELVGDLSWHLVDTVVLHARCDAGDVIVKAAGPANHHIAREIAAHSGVTTPLIAARRTSRMLHADEDLRVFVLEYQPGILVQGSGHELSPDVHRQAGEMLRLIHDAEPPRGDDEYLVRIAARAATWLETDHRIDPADVGAAKEILGSVIPSTVEVVPTHGDWHTRNWLIDGSRVTAIDFGRFGRRTRSSDLCRLAVKEWRASPQLERAFLDGYGADPRDPRVWRLELLCEAIGTAAWARRVRDDAFEAQGLRQLSEALRLF